MSSFVLRILCRNIGIIVVQCNVHTYTLDSMRLSAKYYTTLPVGPYTTPYGMTNHMGSVTRLA